MSSSASVVRSFSPLYKPKHRAGDEKKNNFKDAYFIPIPCKAALIDKCLPPFASSRAFRVKHFPTSLRSRCKARTSPALQEGAAKQGTGTRNRYTAVSTYQSKQFCRISISGNLQNIFFYPCLLRRHLLRKEIHLVRSTIPSNTLCALHIRDVKKMGIMFLRYNASRI